MALRYQDKGRADCRCGYRNTRFIAFGVRCRDQTKLRYRTAYAGKRRLDRRLDIDGPRAFAASDAGDNHDLIHVHWVTGMAGRQAVLPPVTSARVIANRVSSPPRVPWRAISRPSVSRVTALTTSRPPARSIDVTASTTPGLLAPPPMKIASGWERPSSTKELSPSITSSPGTPNIAALRRMRAARSWRRSIATAR